MSSDDQIAQSEDLHNGLTVSWCWAMATWTMIPIGIHYIATGRIESPHDSAIVEGIVFILVGSFVMIPFLVAYRRVAVLEIVFFIFLASGTIFAAALDRVSLSVFTGMGAYLALIWFYLSARRKPRADLPAPPTHEEARSAADHAAPNQDPAGQLVFYMLDSEKQELTAADQFLACTSLTGIDDFYGDYYLTVLDRQRK